MQITAFEAIFLARRINILGCEDYEKYFRTNGVRLHVEIWLQGSYKKHLVH